MTGKITRRTTEAVPNGQTIGPQSDRLAPDSTASLDEALSPTATERLLQAGGASVYVLTKDSELVATVTGAAGSSVPVHVTWSFGELRLHVEHGECKVILLDADFFEGGVRYWIEELCTLDPKLVMLIAAPRRAGDELEELLSSHLAYRVLIKPAAIDLTRAVLDVAVNRYLQRCDEFVAPTVGVEASGNIAAAGNEVPAPSNELLTMREAAARSIPMSAPRQEPVAQAQTYWPWFLPIGLVVTLAVAVFIGDSPLLERWRASDETEGRPSPSFAEPVADAPAANASPDAPTEPPATPVVPDAVLENELPAAEVASAQPSAGPSAASPPVMAEVEAQSAAGDASPAPEPVAVSPAPELAAASFAPELAAVSFAPEPAAVSFAPEPAAAVPAATTPPELEILLAEAWSRIRENRLLDPPGDSAREYVARATELAPYHPDVIAIRSLIGEAVADSARVALESGDIGGAQSLADEALRFGASDETLAVLELELAAAREVAARLHAELLRRGVARIRADRLIAPESDNALVYLSRLRAENPNYPGLESAWQGLGQALTGKVEESITVADWVGAETWLEPLTLVAEPATVERFRAELAVKRLEAEYRSTTAAPDELRLLTAVDPVYPEEAQRLGISGWVDIELIVGIDGIPHEARVVAADPPVTFDEAALAAVSLYRYEPFEHDGRAYERLTRLRISFDPR
jgi:TonB family protein